LARRERDEFRILLFERLGLTSGKSIASSAMPSHIEGRETWSMTKKRLEEQHRRKARELEEQIEEKEQANG
jgi:hypothetical protein